VSQFFGISGHEFNMCLRRRGMWIANIILYVFYGAVLFIPNPDGSTAPFPPAQLWQIAGYVLSYSNMFMVLLGGILAADRMQRDFRLGVRELQLSSPLSLPVYILAKYLGVLAGVSLPMLIWTILVGFYGIFQGAPFYFMGIMLLAFVSMGIPAYAFVIAFSLACPLVMPLRVYQVLFTGYWFWGNYLNPGAFPTISDTLLVPSGKYVMEGLFGGFPSAYSSLPTPSHSASEAYLNLSVLAACILIALTVLFLYLRWQERHV
jgi:ABC-2 type transport system permease protein